MDKAFMDGHMLKQLITNGSIKLKNNMDRINQLNVFPVPDGDTGSNMSATMAAGAKALSTLDEPSIGKAAKALARGMLMGARGNSGVILSQLFSGMAASLKDLDAVNPVDFSLALRKGVEQAYASVINPVEGTMLTVAREGADRALSVARDVDGFEELFDLYIEELNASLERTPDLLPILKEVGVIDSGGAGYIEVVLGMADAIKGVVYEDAKVAAKESTFKPDINLNEIHGGKDFGYCTEFIMQIQKMDEFNQKDFIDMISALGDSLVVVQDENILKVHIHTKTPGDALNLAQHFGFFINLKIENMMLQHTEVMLHQPSEEEEYGECGHDHHASMAPRIKKKYALVAVVNGDGLKDTFIEMGCDYIIPGGQTMNPSIEDFVKACQEINAENILIIPNNKNVLLSAQTAAKMIEGKQVFVLNAKTIAQGYASLTMFDATQDIETNIRDMESHIKNVKTGEITYAIRQTMNKGKQIEKDDYMGLFDDEIKASSPSRLEVAKDLVKEMLDDRSEIITLMVGNNVPDSEVDTIKDMIENDYSVEMEIIHGGQDIYSYIISVE
ncbi:MAG: DAK2 domain-containing protein [Bacilli bacterium]|nr:DAK2 domain-containing protein [Bacilli bacterium]MBN2697114.1 DAK2 domain-containing protein [Bacilli bacterium]